MWLRAAEADRVFNLTAVGVELVDDAAIAVNGPDVAVLGIPGNAVGAVRSLGGGRIWLL